MNLHVRVSSQFHLAADKELLANLQNPSKCLQDQVAVSFSPVRIDLAGGWSDTPPISYETAGTVSIHIKGVIELLNIIIFMLIWIPIGIGT